MKILICDDDKANLRVNQVMVEEYLAKMEIKNSQIVLRQKLNLEEDKEVLEKVDIALLDIDLRNEVDGLKVACEIQKRNPYAAVVFITNYNSYAFDAWEVEASAFLRKPVSIEKLNRVLSRIVLQNTGLYSVRMNRMVSLHSKVIVKEKDIICIQKVSDSKDIKVITDKRVYEFRGTIKDAEKLLCDAFVRINRKTLVNVCYIYAIEHDVLHLTNDMAFPVSYAKQQEIKELCAAMKY